MSTVNIALVAILAPLASALINGLAGRALRPALVHTQAIIWMTISTFASLLLLIVFFSHSGENMILASGAVNHELYTWINLDGIHIGVGLLLDRLSVIMMAMVSFVSLFIHVYSIGYMRGDSGYARFFAYVSLFTFSMMVLVSANNFMQLFFAWEGVGLVSYLLIGFWFHRPSAALGGFKAFVVNRVGDLGFLLGIGVLVSITGSLGLSVILQSVSMIATLQFTIMGHAFPAAELIAMLLFIGAMGKSAQLPLHIWLPESMEGPTPISALIHAATMVTAGVFLLCRMSPLLEYADFVRDFIMIVGSTGALLLGAVALVQYDIKKVVAYSTLSQLGYMMAAVGASGYSIAMFHLLTHAFFKALLFLAAGAVIVALHHEQDMRKMGGLWRLLPITYLASLVGSLALMAIPPSSGFFSKDSIIELVSFTGGHVGQYSYWCLVMGAGVTAAYTVRAFLMTFHGKCNYQGKIHNTGFSIGIALLVLILPSFMVGELMLGPVMSGAWFGGILSDGASFAYVWADWNQHYLGLSWQDKLEHFVYAPAGIATLLGIISAYIVWQFKLNISERYKYVLEAKWGFDTFYQMAVLDPVMWLSKVFYQVGDVLLIDRGLMHGLARLVQGVAVGLRSWQTGYLYHYIGVFILVIVALLSTIYWQIWAL